MPASMKMNHTIRSSIISLLLLSCGSTFAHVHPRVDRPIPLNCDDGGLKVTFHLSKDKIINPLPVGVITPWSDSSDHDHDLIATVTLHNTNPYPITICWINTPLDVAAQILGVFRVYSPGPRGWWEIPIDYPLLNRYWPDEETAPPDVTIPGGEMIERTHVLSLLTRYLREFIDGKYIVRVEGDWYNELQERHMYCFLSPGVEVEVLHQPMSVDPSRL
ncbi:hypothetical protein BGX38DRAFT_1146757 [Terfezia claveryi]|nr:hypothetical protein BGX38DRAFT_1146757 [Terfezia claveryi]